MAGKNQPAPTAAEEELQNREAGGRDTLAEDAKEQRKQQRAEVRRGNPDAADAVDGTPSDMHRSDHVQFNSQTSPERPDQYTIRNPDTDALYGHFVVVTGGEHEGLYGVYESNVGGTPEGDPLVVNVRQRGADNNVVTVNYGDLAPAQSRGNAPR